MPVQAGQMECVTRAADEDTVSDLNVYLFDAYSRELVLHSYLTSMKIADIAKEIHDKAKKIVLIAGPSSSGKTSFAKRLCIQLQVLGLNPLYLGTDDYFINRIFKFNEI